MRVLGIETTCDETAVAVVSERLGGEGGEILSNEVLSQIARHAAYGGVVPEIAARAHIDVLDRLIRRALERAKTEAKDLDAVAAAAGPGLIGGVLVGLTAGKALALALGKPFIAVNHLEAHALTARLTDRLDFPFLALLISGGHTQIVAVKAVGDYRRLGSTVDDAAGEAFDKVARLLRLGYPGGPVVQRAAEGRDPSRCPLPRAWLEGTYDFSFSGLKTAVLRLTEQDQPPKAADVAAGFQDSVVDVLSSKLLRAVREHEARTVLLAGGVAANAALRARVTAMSPVPVRYPPIRYCTDNGAVIASAAYFLSLRGRSTDLSLDVVPNLPVTA